MVGDSSFYTVLNLFGGSFLLCRFSSDAPFVHTILGRKYQTIVVRELADLAQTVSSLVLGFVLFRLQAWMTCTRLCRPNNLP